MTDEAAACLDEESERPTIPPADPTFREEARTARRKLLLEIEAELALDQIEAVPVEDRRARLAQVATYGALCIDEGERNHAEMLGKVNALRMELDAEKRDNDERERNAQARYDGLTSRMDQVLAENVTFRADVLRNKRDLDELRKVVDGLRGPPSYK